MLFIISFYYLFFHDNLYSQNFMHNLMGDCQLTIYMSGDNTNFSYWFYAQSTIEIEPLSRK